MKLYLYNTEEWYLIMSKVLSTQDRDDCFGEKNPTLLNEVSGAVHLHVN